MDIQRAMWSKVKDVTPQYLAVCNHEQQIWLSGAQSLGVHRIAQRFRLVDGQFQIERCKLDWRRCQATTPPGGPVGLRDDEFDVDAGIGGQTSQAWNREVGRAEKDDPARQTLASRTPA
jgi:hypothetical protein